MAGQLKRRRMIKVLKKIIRAKRNLFNGWRIKINPIIRTGTTIIIVLSLLGWVGQSNGARILVDNYYWDYVKPRTEFANALKASGHTVSYNESPITESALAGFDVYVLFLPGVNHDPTLSEADTIANWVEAGHGLWLGAGRDNLYGWADNCNAISSRWGVTYNSDDYTGVVTDITHGHLVTDGVNPPATEVNAFGIYMACTLSLTSGLSLARYSGHDVMANVEPGNGRAILIGDCMGYGPFDDDYLYQHDNRTLAVNTAAYLVPEPGTVLLVGLGGLALLRRRRE
jgi:hypothetical protein